MRGRLRTHGFPIFVLAALAVSGYLAATASIPDPVPTFALQAAPVYRLEVGAACFAAFYLAGIALVLALDGRGFAELGTRGLRATQVVTATNEQKASLLKQAELNQETERDLLEIGAALEEAKRNLSSHEQRLENLERER